MTFKAAVLRASVLLRLSWPAAGIEYVGSAGWNGNTITHRFRHAGRTYEVTDTRTGTPYTYYEYASDSWRGEIECNEINEGAAE